MAKNLKPRKPRSIMILGTRVKIRYPKQELYLNDERLHGAFYADTMTIFIDKEADLLPTLFHEALHAVISISGTGTLISSKVEEALVSAIENGLKNHFKL